ncbi:hypothetical protein C8Q73DRAFT_259228 [Cubamyces lactineus]|nr:hypothetical protein C8Q73DRAFT_259228 [Cubamyces lactineus]
MQSPANAADYVLGCYQTISSSRGQRFDSFLWCPLAGSISSVSMRQECTRPFIIHLSQFARQVFCTHRSPSRTIRSHAYCMPLRLPSWLPACISDHPSKVHSLLPVGPTTKRRLLSARRMESVRPARHCLAVRPVPLHFARACATDHPQFLRAVRPVSHTADPPHRPQLRSPGGSSRYATQRTRRTAAALAASSIIVVHAVARAPSFYRWDRTLRAVLIGLLNAKCNRALPVPGIPSCPVRSRCVQHGNRKIELGLGWRT